MFVTNNKKIKLDHQFQIIVLNSPIKFFTNNKQIQLKYIKLGII